MCGFIPLVRAAIQNLVENAIEHNTDPVEVHIDVETKPPPEDSVAIRIADNGPGIPEAEKRVLFDNGEEPINHGSGLGLWVSKWVIEYFDGDLRFQANEPQGSIVTVLLPRVAEKQDGSPRSSTHQITT